MSCGDNPSVTFNSLATHWEVGTRYFPVRSLLARNCSNSFSASCACSSSAATRAASAASFSRSASEALDGNTGNTARPPACGACPLALPVPLPGVGDVPPAAAPGGAGGPRLRRAGRALRSGLRAAAGGLPARRRPTGSRTAAGPAGLRAALRRTGARAATGAGRLRQTGSRARPCRRVALLGGTLIGLPDDPSLIRLVSMLAIEANDRGTGLCLV
jgi:hypothetical protein